MFLIRGTDVDIVASLNLAVDTVMSCFILVVSLNFAHTNFVSSTSLIIFLIYSGILAQLVVYHLRGFSIVIYNIIIGRPSLLISWYISTSDLTTSFWGCVSCLILAKP